MTRPLPCILQHFFSKLWYQKFHISQMYGVFLFIWEKINLSCAPSQQLERWNTFPVEHQIQVHSFYSQTRSQRPGAVFRAGKGWWLMCMWDLGFRSDQRPIPFLSLSMTNNGIVQEWEAQGLRLTPSITTLRTCFTSLAGARLERLQEHLHFQNIEKIKVKTVFCRKLSGSIGKCKNVSCCWGGHGTGRGDNWTLTKQELNEITLLKQS